MQKPLVLICFFFSIAVQQSMAQDTLPKITVKNISNRIIISWKSTYGANISNINIQRSSDSLKNFRTIGSVLEPMNKENGYVDQKPPGFNMFYKVFVAFEGGTYVFTKSYRPVIDTVTTVTGISRLTGDINSEFVKGVKAKADSAKFPAPPPVPRTFVPSRNIFTAKESNVVISLPNAATHQYSIKFFDDKDRQLFDVPKITEQYLIIEKVNFLHSGWFYFKLYDMGVQIEKNQFYIPREGKFGIPSGEMGRIF